MIDSRMLHLHTTYVSIRKAQRIFGLERIERVCLALPPSGKRCTGVGFLVSTDKELLQPEDVRASQTLRLSFDRFIETR